MNRHKKERLARVERGTNSSRAKQGLKAATGMVQQKTCQMPAAVQYGYGGYRQHVSSWKVCESFSFSFLFLLSMFVVMERKEGEHFEDGWI